MDKDIFYNECLREYALIEPVLSYDIILLFFIVIGLTFQFLDILEIIIILYYIKFVLLYYNHFMDIIIIYINIYYLYYLKLYYNNNICYFKFIIYWKNYYNSILYKSKRNHCYLIIKLISTNS